MDRLLLLGMNGVFLFLLSFVSLVWEVELMRWILGSGALRFCLILLWLAKKHPAYTKACTFPSTYPSDLN